MEQIIKNILIKGSSDREIGMDLWINSNNEKQKPIVVFCHGYKGFKDWGCWHLVAKKFAENGFNFLKFNFSHNGVTPDNILEFADLEAFGNNNYIKELFDLEKVIDWISQPSDYSEVIDSNKIYLIGHSRGGGIATLATARDNRIRKTVTWASVSNLTDRIPKNEEEWKEKGVVYQGNGRTKQNMPLFYQLYENTMTNKNSLDISRLAKKIKTPFCVIHGSEDSVVKVEEAELLDSYISTSNLIVIEGASHTFGSSHPAAGNELPKDLAQVVEESLIFFKD
ncbi:MAG: alpha/beta fold hydrolase [Flavobacteriales bacterium]